MEQSHRRRLIVSYQSVPDLSTWQRIQPDFLAQLPLRNLHWKTASRSLRTIQALDIDLRAYQTLPVEQAQQIPPSLLERPYLHLLFVACDDNEVYRAAIRQSIRDWLDGVSTRRNQEWLIVHVATSKAGPAKFYQRKSTVADKIRADFNIGKRDRVAQLSLGPVGSAEDPVLWAELISKIKDSIITTFDANVVAFEEDVRKIDSQRALPGWNFCMFFIQKEGLALSFEAMNLLEDALIQYDELEASFFQSLRENTLVWFGKLGGTAQGDDSLDLFAANAKPFRDLIKSNTISLFDFRVYLFARQGSLLGRLGRTLEIAKRGTAFVGSLGYSLRQQQSLLDSDFVAAWTYSAATQIVNHCNKSLAGVAMNGTGSEAHYAIRAELLDLAGKQLTKIGLAHLFLPNEEPFMGSLDEESAPPASPNIDHARPPPKTTISHPEIQKALKDEASFHELFGNLLAHTYGDYLASRRVRAADRLQALLAAHDLLCKRNDVAVQRLLDISSSYTTPHWSAIEAALLFTLSRLQAQHGDRKEQLVTTLSLLKAGVTPSGWKLSLAEAHAPLKLSNQLVSDVSRLSQALEKEFAVVAFPTFAVSLASSTGYREVDSEAAAVQVQISNALPCTVAIDDVRLKLTTSDGEHIWFSSGPMTLQSGSTMVKCRSHANVAGACRLETSQIRMSKVIFQYAHWQQSSRDSSPDAKRRPVSLSSPQLVHFALDPLAIRFRLGEALHVAVDGQRSAILRITAGRSDICDGLLTLWPTQNAVILDLAALQTRGGSATECSADKQGIRLQRLPRHQSLELEVPFTIRTNAAAAEILVDLRWSSEAGEQTTRRAKAALRLSLDLSLAVSVQDHFRQTKALSCFNVSTTDKAGLRIADVHIKGAKTVSPRRPDASPTLILPDQPACFAFCFPSRAPSNEEEHPRLVVSYRCIQEEIRGHALVALQSALQDSESSLEPLLEDLAAALASCIANTRSYALFGKLHLVHFHEKRWRKHLHRLYGDSDNIENVMTLLQTVWQSDKLASDESTLPWRTLDIPVERPSMPVLCQASIQLPADCARLTAGEPVKVSLHISTSYGWAATRGLYDELQSQSPRLSYDVSADFADWVIAGRKKGEFDAKDGASRSVNLTLVPLRVGRLSLPRAVATAVAVESPGLPPLAVETYQANAAQQIDVLPREVASTFVVDL